MSATLEAMAAEVHAMAVGKGWWEGAPAERVKRLCRWLHEEVDELEKAFDESGVLAWESTDAEGLKKPEGFMSELADIYLITADLAEFARGSLCYATRKKLSYDQVRKYKRNKAGDFPAEATDDSATA